MFDKDSEQEIKKKLVVLKERRGKTEDGEKPFLFYLYYHKKTGNYWEGRPLYSKESRHYSGGPMEYIEISNEYAEEKYGEEVLAESKTPKRPIFHYLINKIQSVGRLFKGKPAAHPEMKSKQIDKYYPCPSCGFLVFEESAGSYDICKFCGWEDDPVQLANPTVDGGANEESLCESQLEAIKKYPLSIKDADGVKRDPKWRPLSKSEVEFYKNEVTESREPYPRYAVYYEEDYYWNNNYDVKTNSEFALDFESDIPWRIITDSQEKIRLLQELKKELSENHILFNKEMDMIAICESDDYILVHLKETDQYAEVHLTWSGQKEEIGYLETIIYNKMEDWKKAFYC